MEVVLSKGDDDNDNQEEELSSPPPQTMPHHQRRRRRRLSSRDQAWDPEETDWLESWLAGHPVGSFRREPPSVSNLRRRNER